VGKSKTPERRSSFGSLGFLVYLGFGVWKLGFPRLAVELARHRSCRRGAGERSRHGLHAIESVVAALAG
jgi:hypothetical protein